MKPSGRADLASACRCLSAPGLAALGRELSGIGSLGRAERTALVAGAEESLTELLRRKLTRLLLVELHVARVSGLLKAADSESRWDEFVQQAGSADFWSALSTPYPALAHRSMTLIQQRCRAMAELGRRFAADRSAIGKLTGDSEPELRTVRIGAGDSHRGGRAVAILELADSKLVYKPRSLAVDRALGLLLAAVAPDGPGGRIRVPEVVVRPGYGWAEFVEHRYCRSDPELRQYYTGLGHWLAVAQLLKASDLHAENLIACGPIPIVVDCETLFTAHLTPPASGYGVAVDTASALLGDTVLRSGLLPGRGGGLGWRGVDYSGAGGLPGEQPLGQVLQVIDAGTDRARIGSGPMPPMQSANLPSPEPQLRRFWSTVVTGFDQLSERLRELDGQDGLMPLLEPFERVEVRCVLRATEVYAELGRMLWHPAALHDEPAAVQRARELLRQQSEAAIRLPLAAAVIESELADLLIGDVPYFSGRPIDGHLVGPGGSKTPVSPDRVAVALRQWRIGDPAVQRTVMRAALVSAYLDDGPASAEPASGGQRQSARPGRRGHLRGGHQEQRRRRLAGGLVRRLVDAAIVGGDGTATWIAPTLTGTGWSVQSLSPDAYSGTAGVAVVLAGQLHEAAAGRADAVDGVSDVLRGVLNTMRLAEAVHRRSRDQHAVRPEPPGAYVGLGSRIWCWLLLRRLGVVADEGLDRAVELALLLPEAADASSEPDLLLGVSGAMAGLLLLAEESGDPTWLKQAAALGSQLCQAAVREPAGTARWQSPLAPDGLGGLAHGATGIGWVLTRLAAATADQCLAETALAAFAFEESLYDEQRGGWRDLRFPDTPMATAWCHGSVGIGLASADLVRSGASAHHRAVVRRAAATCWPAGPSDDAALCHGDAGRWELLAEATALGLAPTGMELDEVGDQLLASIEDRGVITGISDDACRPGLLSGQGGVAYQLLRMHPDSELDSVLLPKLGSAAGRPV